jgi:serine/threonine protein kinase
MEIDLLKMLQHKNIVHYIEHVCTDLQLSIIMECVLLPSLLSLLASDRRCSLPDLLCQFALFFRYVENGSLESLLRKHGRFPESVCPLLV